MKSFNLKFFFALIFVSSQPIFLQELDEAFLESLPEEVREDLLQEIETKNEANDIQYRRPSTFIQKPEEDSNRFGIEFFSMMQSTMMPLNEPNFDADYILDFGDVLKLQLVGQKSTTFEIPIERDGSIFIPELKKINISGLSLEEAIKIIKNEIKTSYIGVEAYITLTYVRDIQVILSGNVFNPGPYTLNGNSNLFHALTAAGGPSELGSFREVQLVRGSSVIDTIDLYETFIFGRSKFNTRLRSGDIIFVPPAHNLVRISGGIKRPSTYELLKDENVADLFVFANGFSSLADKSDIRLQTIKDNKIDIIELEKRNLKEYELSDGDSVYVRKLPFNTISISGAVRNPGEYILEKGSGIVDLIDRAGGYMPNAYPVGGVLINEKTIETNAFAKDELYKSYLNNLIDSLGISSTYNDSLIELMNQLQESPISGRVSAVFDLEVLKDNPELDVMLQDKDKVMIPEFKDIVYVYGEVSNPGNLKYYENENIMFYIKKKGDFTSFADKRSIFITHPDGTTQEIQKNKFMSNSNKDIEVYPGSIIFVPRERGNKSIMATQTAQAYATILGNLGISLASLSVLKDND